MVLGLRPKGFQVFTQLIADATKSGESFFFRALHGGWVIEVAVDGKRLSGKDRAAFPGVVALGQNVVKMLAGELVGAFSAVAEDVDAQLLHRGIASGRTPRFIEREQRRRWRASIGIEGANHWKSNVAAIAQASCAAMNPGASTERKRIRRGAEYV